MTTKNILFIAAPKNFRDEEYSIPKKILEAHGAKITTASTIKGNIEGRFGLTAKSDMLIENVNVENFDAIVFVGGSGASVFCETAAALNLARSFYNAGKLTAAICIAPTILATAGILKAKKATVFLDGINILVQANAIFTGTDIEIDGNIITAKDFEASQKFAEAIAKKLCIDNYIAKDEKVYIDPR